MNREVVTAEIRELSSKGYLKELRNSGRVPAVLYGRGGDSLPLTVDAISLTKAISTSAGMNVLLNVEVAGHAPQIAMIKELERDVLKTGVFSHVDFVRVSLDHKIEVTVPVTLVGEEKRVNDGGVVAQPLREVTLMAVPGTIPENVPVDISALKIGDSVTVGDLSFPEGCDLITEAGEMLVSIMQPRVAQEDTADEAADAEAPAAEETPE